MAETSLTVSLLNQMSLHWTESPHKDWLSNFLSSSSSSFVKSADTITTAGPNDHVIALTAGLHRLWDNDEKDLQWISVKLKADCTFLKSLSLTEKSSWHFCSQFCCIINRSWTRHIWITSEIENQIATTNPLTELTHTCVWKRTSQVQIPVVLFNSLPCDHRIRYARHN